MTADISPRGMSPEATPQRAEGTNDIPDQRQQEHPSVTPTAPGAPSPVNKSPLAPTPDQAVGTRGWRARAACLDHDPELWFSDLPAYRHQAMRVCFSQCPVRDACFTWANANNQHFGIWGGADFEIHESRRGEAWARGEVGKCRTAPDKPFPGADILDRMSAARAAEPDTEFTPALMAERLGYKNEDSFLRQLYRLGPAGREAAREFLPESFTVHALRVPVLVRLADLERDHPGILLGEASVILGYRNPKSLERVLYQQGPEGTEAIRRLKPGSRSREKIAAKAINAKKIKADRAHPWIDGGPKNELSDIHR